MPGETGLERVAARGLQKCLGRITRASDGEWLVTGIEVYPGGAAAALAPYEGLPTAAVFISVTEPPLTGFMTADPADLESISRAFTGHSFPHSGRITPAEEVMFTELGNILINGLLDSLLNELKTAALPALPLFAAGDAAALARELGTRGAGARVIEARLAVKCDGPADEIAVFALVPEDLARRLD